MKYFGGKFHSRKAISAILKLLRKPGQTYFEPFVGGAWVMQEMDGPRIACDAHEALINFYKGCRLGWTPPSTFTEGEYNAIKKLRNVNDPLTAFVGFECSFGGKYFRGWARGNNFYLRALNGLQKQRPLLKDIKFLDAADYTKHNPTNMLIYCDPPYANTANYSTGKFNSAQFWDVMRWWSVNNTVIISEYSAPKDFECIHQHVILLSVRSTKGREPRIEKLFMHRGF
jgi:DNA adenine methylase